MQDRIEPRIQDEIERIINNAGTFSGYNLDVSALMQNNETFLTFCTDLSDYYKAKVAEYGGVYDFLATPEFVNTDGNLVEISCQELVEMSETTKSLLRTVMIAPGFLVPFELRPGVIAKKAAAAAAVAEADACVQSDFLTYPQVYLNTAVLTGALRELSERELKDISAQLLRASETNFPKERHPENLALAICLAQEVSVYPGVNFRKTNAGSATLQISSPMPSSTERKLLLLSSPTLNFSSRGNGKNIKNELDRIDVLKAYYRNILQCAKDKRQDAVIMSAPGLGEFAGDGGPIKNVAEMHFDALTSVAGEFPRLIIIYNPARKAKNLEEYRTQKGSSFPKNITVTNKDVLHVVQLLCAAKINCGLVNPSDWKVAFGASPIGCHFESARENNLAAEEWYLGFVFGPSLPAWAQNPEVPIIARELCFDGRSLGAAACLPQPGPLEPVSYRSPLDEQKQPSTADNAATSTVAFPTP